MKVLSLFDGISGAAQALLELNIDCTYYASEIDKYAIQISKKNHLAIIQLGDVKSIDFNRFKGIDLLIAGFPCQSFSGAGKQKGFEDERGQLFYKCLEALENCKPKWFLFENVASMKPAVKDFISEKFGVQPIMINSALLTAQSRKRLYWTNIPVEQPEDKGVLLKDIIENGIVDRDKSLCLDANYFKGGNLKQYFEKSRRQLVFMVQKPRGFNKGGIKALDGKTPTLSSCSWQTNNHLVQDGVIRKLTVKECERLQDFPDNYTDNVSNSQAYKALGNSFTVPVIKHILKGIL